MPAPKRAEILSAIQKVLPKHYQPYKAMERPILEQMLYASCLEDSAHEIADECFARLQESFFDWNEVRVTSVRELGEMLRGTLAPEQTATRIKQILHGIFEALYDFNLESLHKQNLGVAIKQLEQLRGTTPFAVAYVVQNSLGGHAIPLSPAALEILQILGFVTEKEIKDKDLPGLERSIPKNKGPEFASLIQQFAADYAAAPFGTGPRNILLEIDPNAKARLPKRTLKKPDEVVSPPPAPAAVESDDKKKAPKSAARPTDKVGDKPQDKAGNKSAMKEPAAKEPAAKEPAAKEPAAKESAKKDGKEAAATNVSPEPTKEVAKATAKKKEPTRETAKEVGREATKEKAATKEAGKDAAKEPVKDAAKATAKDAEKKKTVKKKSVAPPPPAPPAANKKKTEKKTSKPIAKKASPSAKKSASKQLARRKPR